ncbi:MAG: OmpA family protein [Flavobacteriales bacterium]
MTDASQVYWTPVGRLRLHHVPLNQASRLRLFIHLTMSALLALTAVPICMAQGTAEINLYFNGAKQKPMPKHVARLDSLLNTVDRSRILGITLVGHTDSLGGRPSNEALAGKRASSVKKLLLDRGIPEPLITITAFDAPVPVVENITSTGRSRNRRVFVRVEYGPADVPVRSPAE